MNTYESQAQSSEEANGARQLAPSIEGRAGVLICIALLLVVAYWTGLYLAEEQSLLRGSSDFSVWYSAGKMVLTGQSSKIYDYPAQIVAQQHLFGSSRTLMPPFTLGPYILALFTPLALLSYANAVILWYIANIAILVSIPFLLRQRLQLTGKQIAVALLSLAFFYPISVSLVQGQLTPLTLLLFTLVFLNLGKRHDFLAGSILAVGLYKPHFVLPLLLVLAFIRNWKAIQGFLGTTIVLLIASVMLVGWNSTMRFPQAILALSTIPPRISEPGGERMVNVRGLIQWLFASHLPHSSVMLIAGLASLALVLALLVVVRKDAISELGFALVIAVTVLASYHCYKHDMGPAILALFLVGHYITQHEMTNLRMALAASAGLTLFAPSILPSPATVIVLIFFSAIIAAALLRTRALETTSSEEFGIMSPGIAGGGTS